MVDNLTFLNLSPKDVKPISIPATLSLAVGSALLPTGMKRSGCAAKLGTIKHFVFEYLISTCKFILSLLNMCHINTVGSLQSIITGLSSWLFGSRFLFHVETRF